MFPLKSLEISIFPLYQYIKQLQYLPLLFRHSKIVVVNRAKGQDLQNKEIKI